MTIASEMHKAFEDIVHLFPEIEFDNVCLPGIFGYKLVINGHDAIYILDSREGKTCLLSTYWSKPIFQGEDRVLRPDIRLEHEHIKINETNIRELIGNLCKEYMIRESHYGDMKRL